MNYINSLIQFIEYDITTNCYELQSCTTTFYVDKIDEKFVHIDSYTFKENERQYSREMKMKNEK